jgi:PAS domain S-box-containing protein
VLNGGFPSLGYTAIEVENLDTQLLQTLSTHDELPHIIGSIQETIASPENHIIKSQWKLRSKQGQVRIFYVTQTLLDSNPVAPVTIGFAEDITEQKDLEKTAEKEHARRLQFEKYAALMNLGAGVAHDIANPLAAILSRAQVLKLKVKKNNIEPTFFEQGLEKIETHVDRITNTLNALRLMTKDNSKESISQIKLGSIFEQIKAVWKQRLENHGFTLAVSEENLQLEFSGRQSEILTAIFNIITYNYDLLDKKEIEVKLISIDSNINNGKINIVISSSAPPLSVKTADRILEPYYSETDTMDGSLGLSIAKNIANNHGGELVAHSDSKTMKFTFEVPLLRPMDAKQTA